MSVLSSIRPTNYPPDYEILTCGSFELGTRFYEKALDIEKLKITDSDTEEAKRVNEQISKRQTLYKFFYVSSRVPIFGPFVLLIAKARSKANQQSQKVIVRNDIPRYYPTELSLEQATELQIRNLKNEFCLIFHHTAIEKDMQLLSSEIARLNSLKIILASPQSLNDLNLPRQDFLTIIFYRAIYSEEMNDLKNALDENNIAVANAFFIKLQSNEDEVVEDNDNKKHYTQIYKKNPDDEEFLLKEAIPELTEKCITVYEEFLTTAKSES